MNSTQVPIVLSRVKKKALLHIFIYSETRNVPSHLFSPKIQLDSPPILPFWLYMGKVTWPLIIFPFHISFGVIHMYLSDLLSSPEHKSSKHDFIFKTSILWFEWRKFLPCKTFLPHWPAKTATTQVLSGQYISLLVFSLIPCTKSHPMSLTSNPQGLLKFSVLLKHRNTACSDFRVLQISGSSKV